MWQQLAPAFRMTLLLTVLTGLIYPGVVTGLCQVLFNKQAHGSLITSNGQVVGSRLLGQNFTKPEYFHPRPSAAGNDGYDPTASSGSNLGPTNQKLYDRMKAAAAQFRKDNPTFTGPIPADALTASGSGLDPEISVANAEAQANRVAEARKASPDQVLEAVHQFTAHRDLGFLGEARVNVLELNLALDQKYPPSTGTPQPPVK
jgi:potassium-transporting ATPase KdpC subunit